MANTIEEKIRIRYACACLYVLGCNAEVIHVANKQKQQQTNEKKREKKNKNNKITTNISKRREETTTTTTTTTATINNVADIYVHCM